MTNAERLADEIFALIERTSPRGLVRSELVALIEREQREDGLRRLQQLTQEHADREPTADDWKVSAEAQKRFNDSIASAWDSLGKVPDVGPLPPLGGKKGND